MKETISFPGLGLDFDVSRIAFTLPEFLGSISVYWYGIFISLGLLLGVLYYFKRIKEFGLDPDRSIDVIIAGVVFSIVGGRLYYVMFSWQEYKNNPISVFFIREGGLAIYGAVIAAFLAGFIMCRIRKVKFLPAADLALGSVLLGTAIGRWGNFTNIEAFGSNTSLPWGMTSPSVITYLSTNAKQLQTLGVIVDPSQPVHPTFLYESLWCLAGFLFIVWFTKRRRFDGQLSLIYLGWYGLGRFFIEGLRTDSLLLGAVRVSQILALICVIISVFVMFFVLSKIKREGDDNYLMLYVNTDEGQKVLAGDFYKKKTDSETSDNTQDDDTGEATDDDEPLEDTVEPDDNAENEDTEDSGDGKDN